MSQEVPIPFSSLTPASTIADKEILIADGDILERIRIESFALLLKIALGIQNIATIDSAPNKPDGNVFDKDQVNSFLTVVDRKINDLNSVIINIKNALTSNDINLDELQEIVNYIKLNRTEINELKGLLIGKTFEDFFKEKFKEEEISVTDSMISGMQVSLVLNEILNPELERTVVYNGVYISKSMSTIDSNNKLVINLAPLGINPKVTDFITIKYYKK